jgi:hypothetical protein
MLLGTQQPKITYATEAELIVLDGEDSPKKPTKSLKKETKPKAKGSSTTASEAAALYTSTPPCEDEDGHIPPFQFSAVTSPIGPVTEYESGRTFSDLKLEDRKLEDMMASTYGHPGEGSPSDNARSDTGSTTEPETVEDDDSPLSRRRAASSGVSSREIALFCYGIWNTRRPTFQVPSSRSSRWF